MKGRINMESELNEGTTFTIYIPQKNIHEKDIDN
jgi:signal transduction histidine kinase